MTTTTAATALMNPQKATTNTTTTANATTTTRVNSNRPSPKPVGPSPSATKTATSKMSSTPATRPNTTPTSSCPSPASGSTTPSPSTKTNSCPATSPCESAPATNPTPSPTPAPAATPAPPPNGPSTWPSPPIATTNAAIPSPPSSRGPKTPSGSGWGWWTRSSKGKTDRATLRTLLAPPTQIKCSVGGRTDWTSFRWTPRWPSDRSSQGIWDIGCIAANITTCNPTRTSPSRRIGTRTSYPSKRRPATKWPCCPPISPTLRGRSIPRRGGV
mmetsp:Transcript_8541/g.17861  ORF Transcript_8541/g.17861 Transcript_8541/m.17861 type:complete len:272 (-) Transcript_8541:1070-1885(-)